MKFDCIEDPLTSFGRGAGLEHVAVSQVGGALLEVGVDNIKVGAECEIMEHCGNEQ